MDSQQDQRIAEFLASHHAIAWKIARSFSRDGADCDDLFQEIYISIWTAYDRIPDSVSETTYLYRVALNRAISWRRKQQSYLGHLQAYLLGNPSPEVSPELGQQDQTEQLYAAIRQLSETDRSLILLYLDEVGYPEMAEILGVAQATVRKRVSRVKQRLSNLIQPEEERE